MKSVDLQQDITFETLYLPCHEALYKTALYYGFKNGIADDILQQTVIDAMQNFYQLKDKAYFKTWITRILINNFKREYKRIKSSERIDDINKSSIQSNVEIEEKVVSTLYIKDLLRNLKDKYRIVVTLKYLNNLTIYEISKVLKISQNTIKSRLYRALELLKNEMENDCYERE